jgi:hypothetical protein
MGPLAAGPSSLPALQFHVNLPGPRIFEYAVAVPSIPSGLYFMYLENAESDEQVRALWIALGDEFNNDLSERAEREIDAVYTKWVDDMGQLLATRGLSWDDLDHDYETMHLEYLGGSGFSDHRDPRLREITDWTTFRRDKAFYRLMDGVGEEIVGIMVDDLLTVFQPVGPKRRPRGVRRDAMWGDRSSGAPPRRPRRGNSEGPVESTFSGDPNTPVDVMLARKDGRKAATERMTLDELLASEAWPHILAADPDAQRDADAFALMQRAGFQVAADVSMAERKDGAWSAVAKWLIDDPDGQEDAVGSIVFDSAREPFASLLHRSTRPGVRWQLSRFQMLADELTPVGHSDILERMVDAFSTSPTRNGISHGDLPRMVTLLNGTELLRAGTERVSNPRTKKDRSLVRRLRT